MVAQLVSVTAARFVAVGGPTDEAVSAPPGGETLADENGQDILFPVVGPLRPARLVVSG